MITNHEIAKAMITLRGLNLMKGFDDLPYHFGENPVEAVIKEVRLLHP